MEDNAKSLGRILVVDDNPDILMSMELLLKRFYEKVVTLSNPDKIPDILRQSDFDVVLLDMNFTRDAISGKEGFYWLEKINLMAPDTSVVMMTAYADMPIVIEAIKIGASDFLEKPFSNDQLLATLTAGLKHTESKRSVSQLNRTKTGLGLELNGSQPFIGKSKPMQDIFATISKVAITDANILILGESGTGKELTARAIHNNSTRRDQPFISIDMGSISENLFESELFGHKKGAFTDAVLDRIGKFELANGGTLFLDEIGNLPLTQQIKLLKVIQDKQITPLGSNTKINTDCRLICATNEDLLKKVHEESFRHDLLYRINTIELKLPPLRERKGDIAFLANYYIEYFNKKYRRQAALDQDNLKRLESYPWPGNVRELSHVIERSVILSEDNQILLNDLVISSQEKSEVPIQTFNLSEVEKGTIERAIQYFDGNLSQAAKALGLTRGALYRRLDKYRL